MIDAHSPSARRVRALLTLALWWTSAAASAQPLSLRIPDETVAAGGVLQAKLELTEPRPIRTGGGVMSFDGYDEFLGLAVQSPNGDAAAAGVMRGATLRVRMVSPTSDIGSAGEYPMLTTTLKAPPLLPPGSQSALTMSGAQFTGPGGVPYAFEMKAGVATVGPASTASVIDVTPGSAAVPAGGTIVITGLGFEPGTKVKLKDAAVASVQFVDSKALIVTPAQAVTMHGQEIEIEIPSTRQKLVYYSYQRTAPLGRSVDALFGAVEPAFPRQVWTSAIVRFAADTAAGRAGFAVQNEGAVPSTVGLTLLTPAGAVGPFSAVLPANTRAVRSVAEIFGPVCAAGCALRVTASAPIQLFGLEGDVAADAVTPVLPAPDVPAVLDLATAANATAYRSGDLVTVSAQFSPGVVPALVDAYVVLQTPAGDYQSLTPSGLQPGIRPLMTRVSVAAAATVEVLRALVPPGVLPGRYQWLSALAAPGTLRLLTPIRATPFDVVP